MSRHRLDVLIHSGSKNVVQALKDGLRAAGSFREESLIDEPVSQRARIGIFPSGVAGEHLRRHRAPGSIRVFQDVVVLRDVRRSIWAHW